MSQTGAGAAAAQPAEAYMAASERPVPGVPETAHERHAEDRECVIIRTASPGGGDEEERPGTHTLTHTHERIASLFKSEVNSLCDVNRTVSAGQVVECLP